MAFLVRWITDSEYGWPCCHRTKGSGGSGCKPSPLLPPPPLPLWLWLSQRHPYGTGACSSAALPRFRVVFKKCHSPSHLEQTPSCSPCSPAIWLLLPSASASWSLGPGFVPAWSVLQWLLPLGLGASSGPRALSLTSCWDIPISKIQASLSLLWGLLWLAELYQSPGYHQVTSL